MIVMIVIVIVIVVTGGKQSQLLVLVLDFGLEFDKISCKGKRMLTQRDSNLRPP